MALQTGSSISSAVQSFCISCDPICQFLLSFPERRRSFLYLGVRRAWCWPAEPEVSRQWHTLRSDGSGEQGWGWLGRLYLSAWSVWANHHVPRDGTVRTATGLLKSPMPDSGERVTECDDAMDSWSCLRTRQSFFVYVVHEPPFLCVLCLSVHAIFPLILPITYVFFFLSILFILYFLHSPSSSALKSPENEMKLLYPLDIVYLWHQPLCSLLWISKQYRLTCVIILIIVLNNDIFILN